MDVIVGEYKDLWRFEYWMWYFPHPNYYPTNNGRIHLFLENLLETLTSFNQNNLVVSNKMCTFALLNN